jgi:UDP-N-acetylmuramyl pentapeptide synthase
MQIIKNKVAAILAWFTRKILAKYKPKVIGITGSVGKTSARNAIYTIVSQTLRARQPIENYNNEFGLPFTIIGVKSPGRSIGKWISLFLKALSLVFFKQRYPQVLILEMGVDHPGDMDYLLSLVQPDIALITGVGMSHYEFFANLETIEKEKGKLAQGVNLGGTVIANADNQAAMRIKSAVKTSSLSYAVNNQADVMIKNIEESLQGKYFTNFKVVTPARTYEGKINAVGNVHLSALLSALAVAEVSKIDTESITKALMNYKPVPGRLNIIPGIKHSVLIDDTYNAAPDSMVEAFALFDRMPGNFRMVVLGDMLELGAAADEAHTQVGHRAAALNLDYLVTVGPGGQMIADSAREAGMLPEKIVSFATAEQAKRQVQELLKPEGLVLIKGSQGVRMEKITLEIMAEPMRASELLCRQYGKWLES